MGGKNSKNASAGAGSSTSGAAASAAAASAPLTPNSVVLNVYEPAQNASPMGGVYHSGIVLFDTEYMFAQGNSSVSGIVEHRPRVLSDSQWQFREALRLGETSKSRQDVRALIAQLKAGGEWRGDSYNVMRKNCNHFTAAVAKELGLEVPGWVNRAARMGSALGMGGAAGSGRQPVDLDGRPLRPEDTAALVLDASPEDVTLDALLDFNKLAVLGAKPTQRLASIVPVNAKGERVQLKPDAILSSDADEQLLLFLPFTRAVRVKFVLLRLSVKDLASNPRTVKFFADQPNLSFSDVGEVKPAHVWEIPQRPDNARPWSKVEEKQGVYEAVVALQGARWKQSLAHLAVFVEGNHGAPTTKLHGITVVGRDK